MILGRLVQLFLVPMEMEGENMTHGRTVRRIQETLLNGPSIPLTLLPAKDKEQSRK